MGIKQFKFTNGDEIICEILSQEPEEDEMIVRYAFKITRIEGDEEISYYSFAPWMILKDKVEEPISINAYHIVAMCYPEKDMVTQYKQAISRFALSSEESVTMGLNDAIDALNSIVGDLDDSDEDNILAFTPPNKLH